MQEKHHLAPEQESYFLNTFPLIRQITLRRLRGACREQAEDLAQKIGLNLWRWRVNRHENRDQSATRETAPAESGIQGTVLNDHRARESGEPLTQAEWLRIANTAARHEVSSFYRRRYRREAALATAEMTELAAGRAVLTTKAGTAVEGNSQAEIASLLCRVWEIIDAFPVTRKYAYLLGKEELLINFITHGCATRREIAASLRITLPELDRIIGTLPVPDEIIRQQLALKSGAPVSLRQVWTWRAKAKARLAEKLRKFI